MLKLKRGRNDSGLPIEEDEEQECEVNRKTRYWNSTSELLYICRRG